MLDPDEGLAPDGTIRTGARRDRVPAAFEPVLAQAVRELTAAGGSDVEIHLYGSVATGRAVPGRSDVDLLTLGVPGDAAAEVGAALSQRFRGVCREVAVGAATRHDLLRDDDEGYGNRVFLRHYCVLLHAPGHVQPLDPFPGDRRAARGFNGDVGLHLARWREVGAPDAAFGRRVARKTLLALAGLVSVHDSTWTTDRGTAARRWAEVEPVRAQDLSQLLAWAEGEEVPTVGQVRAALAPDGVVEQVVRRFAADVGLWEERGSPV